MTLKSNKAIKVMRYTRQFWYGVRCALLVQCGTPYCRRYVSLAHNYTQLFQWFLRVSHMIRQLGDDDLQQVISIWLDASINAHHFVPADFWRSQVDAMRDVYIPASDTWVYEYDGVIQGFISHHDGVLAALFVNPQQQSNGIGKHLMEHIKQQYSALSLTVYKDNQRAVNFYIREGFSLVQEQTCSFTGNSELLLAWNVET